MEKTELAVGDSTRLEIILSTKTYRSRVSKHPRIQTNEGPPDKRVTISATIMPRPDSTYPVVVSPYKVDLSQLGDKVINQSPITLTNVSDKDLSLELIAGADEYFTLDLPENIPAKGAAKGMVKITDDMQSQSFEKSFTIELTPSEGGPEGAQRFTVPVKRTVRAHQTAGNTRVLKRDGK